MTKETAVKSGAWALSVMVVIVAFVVWLPDQTRGLSHVSTYKLFPLFGLLAFSLMWAHYIASASRLHFGVDRGVLKTYFQVTSLAVLAVILLHPGLLWWQLWRDGFGLPPESYLKHYVSPSLGWVAILGTISWFVFLAYEFHRKFGERTWWKYVQYASDVAMLAVFYHGLRLGSQLHKPWFRVVWLFYGITLLIAFGVIYSHKLKAKPL